MTAFAEVMAANPPRLVVLYQQAPDGGERFQWGVVGQIPLLSMVGAMSGLMPGVIRRNTLKTACSSKMTLVLLCSALETRAAASVGSSAPGSLPNRTSPTVADESKSDRRYFASAGL